jgi:hypothetical protein
MLFARRLGSAFAVEHGERAVEILDSEVFRDQTLEEAYPQWHLGKYPLPSSLFTMVRRTPN